MAGRHSVNSSCPLWINRWPSRPCRAGEPWPLLVILRSAANCSGSIHKGQYFPVDAIGPIAAGRLFRRWSSGPGIIILFRYLLSVLLRLNGRLALRNPPRLPTRFAGFRPRPSFGAGAVRFLRRLCAGAPDRRRKSPDADRLCFSACHPGGGHGPDHVPPTHASPLSGIEPPQVFGNEARELLPCSTEQMEVLCHHLEPFFQLLVADHVAHSTPPTGDKDADGFCKPLQNDASQCKIMQIPDFTPVHPDAATHT